MPDHAAAVVEQEVLAAEQNAAFRAAFAELPPGCRRLLSMLMRDPPCSYAEISATLGVAVGSIGAMRARCLQRLRHSPHLTTIIGAGPPDAGVKQTRGARGD